MERRTLLRVLGGSAIVAGGAGLGGCSSALPASAVAAWQGPGPRRPDEDPRRWMLGWAILAPHSHNLQSWIVDLRQPGEITLLLDRTRLLPETDPFARQIMMSQGTFLELLDLAARECGLRATITLFPDGPFEPRVAAGEAPVPRATARIRFEADAAVARDPLFAQIPRRHTNRQAYEARQPDASALAAIQQAARQPGLRVATTDAASAALLPEHRRIAQEAWGIELATPRTQLESLRVLRVGPSEIAEHRDGISINEPLVRLLVALGLFDRGRAAAPDAAAIQRQIRDFNASIESTLAFFSIVSEGNDRATQIQAGRAYVRAQLAATALGLSMHPLQQALQEYPEQAGPHAAIHRLLGARPGQDTVQMWARLGFAPPVGPAPRRGVDAHLLRA